MTSASTARRHVFPAQPFLRRITPAAVTLLLHALAFEWFSGKLHPITWQRPAERVVTMVLEPVAATPPSARAATPLAVRHEKLRPKPAFARHAALPAQSVDMPVADVAMVDPAAGMEVPGTSVDLALALADTGKPEAAAAPPAAPPATENKDKTHYHVSPPPSIELQYDVQKVSHDGKPIYGHGKISWQVDGDRYAINGEAGVLFITALTFKSEGVIDEYGVAPALYSEKRFRRSETDTHFQRERNTISFSASTQTYPRQGGEQDRASIVWQLAGIGRGDSTKFAPDAEIDVFVAGVRDGEVWRIQVIGEEDIDAGGGKMKAWHVTRMPRPGSYDQKLDIWLAPQFDWYPVKIRYTETNGDYLDMSVSNLKLAASH
jgi:hypothetical protein